MRIAKNLHFRSACQIFHTRNDFEALSDSAKAAVELFFLPLESIVYYSAQRRISGEHFSQNNEGFSTARIRVCCVCNFSGPC